MNERSGNDEVLDAVGRGPGALFPLPRGLVFGQARGEPVNEKDGSSLVEIR